MPAVIIRISPMAHLLSVVTAVSLLAFLPLLGNRMLALMVLPALFSIAIVRLRTTADADAVTARGLRASRTMRWEQIEGLRFNRGAWARACLRDGTEATLPAVTFATLPRLTSVSGGRVPNPYQ